MPKGLTKQKKAIQILIKIRKQFRKDNDFGSILGGYYYRNRDATTYDEAFSDAIRLLKYYKKYNKLPKRSTFVKED